MLLSNQHDFRREALRRKMRVAQLSGDEVGCDTLWDEVDSLDYSMHDNEWWALGGNILTGCRVKSPMSEFRASLPTFSSAWIFSYHPSHSAAD